jgi:hypothetical protein
MRACLALAAALAASPLAQLRAQRSPPALHPPIESCSYDACALRVEPGGFFSRPTLVRGLAAERVARAGFRGFDLQPIVQGADSAVHYARAYRASQTRASISGLTATLLGITAAIVSQSSDDSAVPYTVAASVVGVYTGYEVRRSLGRLSRSLWWYNQRVAAPR